MRNRSEVTELAEAFSTADRTPPGATAGYLAAGFRLGSRAGAAHAPRVRPIVRLVEGGSPVVRQSVGASRDGRSRASEALSQPSPSWTCLST